MDPIFELNIALPAAKHHRLQQSIIQQLTSAIVDGRLKADICMPATRKLADHLQVSRNTVIAVYATLVSEGYLYAKSGSGTFVADIHQQAFKQVLQQQVLQPTEITEALHQQKLTAFWRGTKLPEFSQPQSKIEFDFSVGKPEVSFLPFDIWRKLLTKVSRQHAQHKVTGGIAQGQLTLRQAIAQHISLSRAVACDAESIVVTAGAQQALDILARILITPGQTQVAMESPGYPMARQLFAAAGAQIIDIEVDEQGILVESIPNSCRVIYVTPSHQFPTGVKLSADRRLQLLAFAQQYNASIIEDDYDGEIRLQGSPLDALQTLDTGATVFYVGTFSKCLLPDLRLGFVVVPPWAKEAVLAAKMYCDWHCPVLLQDTLALFIQQGHLKRHLQKLRKCYRQRLDQLNQSLNDYLPKQLTAIPISTGAHMAAIIHGDANAQEIAQAALAQRIKIFAIQDFSMKPPTMNGLIFGLGGINEKQIDEGVQRLARLFE